MRANTVQWNKITMDIEVTIFKGESEKKYFWGKCSVNRRRIINLTFL